MGRRCLRAHITVRLGSAADNCVWFVSRAPCPEHHSIVLPAGHLGVVQLLVDRGIDVRCRNDGALLAAAFKGHMAVAQLLLLKGCRVDSQRVRLP